MAAFGEIRESFSRATLTWDDAEITAFLPKLSWQLPFELPDEIGKFFIFEGKNLWSGVRAKRTLQEVNYVREANLHLYKKPRAQHYIVVVKDCELLICGAVVKLLRDMLARSKMVVTIQEKPLSEYQTDQPITTPNVIRKIRTINSVNVMKENIPNLEQPNMITGVSAGAFTLRQQLRLSATAVVIYMENAPEDQVEDIENLLQKLDMSEAAPGSPKVNGHSNPNLYT